MTSQQEFIEPPDNDFDFRSLINKITYHWPLFVFMVLVSMVCGNLYLRYTTPLYEASATLLIKGGKKTSYAEKVIQEIDVFEGVNSIENEIELLRSGPIIQQVVDSLDLHHLYRTEGQIRKVDVYAKIPYKLKLYDPGNKLVNQEFILDRFKNGTFLVITPDGLEHRVRADSTVKMPWGHWSIQMVPNRFADWYYDTEVKLMVMDPALMAIDLSARLSLNQKSQDAALIDLSIQDPVLERAVDFLGMLFKVYNQASIDDKNLMATGTMRFLNERLDVIKIEIDSVENEIQQFRIKNGITDPQIEMDLARTGVLDSKDKVGEFALKQMLIADLQKTVKAGLPLQFMPSDFGIGDASLSLSVTKYNDLVLDRVRFQSMTSSKSPLLDLKDEELNVLKESVLSNLNTLNLSISKMRKDSESRLNDFKSLMGNIPAIRMELEKFIRQKEIKEQLYLLLLQKREEAALTLASTTADSRIVEKPIGSPDPVTPKRERILVISIVVGLVLPLAYIFVKDAFNTKIIGLEMITKITSTPLLGELSEHPQKNAPVVVTDKSRSTISEQFRTIRTNLHYIHGGQTEKCRTTMITSSTSGEGKTFFAINLASALALSGRKVVLLELDLRKPKISRYLNQKPEFGFSQFMAGIASIDQIVIPSGVHENLDLISSGLTPPNPSELLLNERYDEMMLFLKQHYQDIIIDTPPIGLVTDAQIISRQADASVFMVRWGYTDKTWIPSIETLYRDQKLPGLSIIFNGVRLGGRYGYSYGYGYDYGYSKGYAYGYGHGKKYGYYDEDGEKKESIWSLFVNLIKRI